jgi:predicted TIM-barrel fold metal-dependent hydrolase
MIELEYDRVDWIALTREEAVDAERRIIDAHHHLWDRPNTARYLLDELVSDTRASHNVTDTVFVECRTGYREEGPEAMRPVGEIELISGLAQISDHRATRIAAIVGYADMTRGDRVEEVLHAHEAAGGGRFRGVRHATLWDAALDVLWGLNNVPGLLRDEGFRRGVARLGHEGYSFDALVFHPQLRELADLARATDGTTIVVEHLGYPLGVGPYADRDAVRSEWRTGLTALATCANTVLKLGGIGMDFVFGTGWSAGARPPASDEVVERWGDDVRWCIDTFGPSRCMFESNYPVDRNSLGYTVLWNSFQKMATSYSEAEQHALFAGTAARVYRIT